jgi:hypothetical protein
MIFHIDSYDGNRWINCKTLRMVGWSNCYLIVPWLLHVEKLTDWDHYSLGPLRRNDQFKLAAKTQVGLSFVSQQIHPRRGGIQFRLISCFDAEGKAIWAAQLFITANFS